MKQALKIGRLCGILLVILPLISCGVKQSENDIPREPPVPVHTVKVEKKSLPPTLKTSGIVVCMDTHIVSSGVEGPLDKINVLPGQEVQRGSVIAEIEQSSLEIEKRRLRVKGVQLHNDLLQAKKAARKVLEEAERRLMEKERMDLVLQRTERDLKKARIELAAAEKIHSAGGIPEHTLEESRSTLTSAEEQLRDIKIRIASAEIGLRDSDFKAEGKSPPKTPKEREKIFLALCREKASLPVNRVEQQIADHRLVVEAVERQLELCTIRSPEHGFITTIGATEGAYLKRGDPICSLIDPRQLYFRTHISEANLRKVDIGMPLQYSLPHREARWTGRVRQIFPQVDPYSKSVPLLCAPDTSGPELHPGEYVEIEIELGPPEQFLVLPVLTLREERSESRGTVFSVKNGLAFENTLQIEEHLEDSFYFLEGPVTATEVIMNPPVKLRDGTPVSIIPKEQTTSAGTLQNTTKESPN